MRQLGAAHVALGAEAAKLEDVAGRAVASRRGDYIARLADTLPGVHDAERRLAAVLAEVAGQWERRAMRQETA